MNDFALGLDCDTSLKLSVSAYNWPQPSLSSIAVKVYPALSKITWTTTTTMTLTAIRAKRSSCNTYGPMFDSLCFSRYCYYWSCRFCCCCCCSRWLRNYEINISAFSNARTAHSSLSHTSHTHLSHTHHTLITPTLITQTLDTHITHSSHTHTHYTLITPTLITQTLDTHIFFVLSCPPRRNGEQSQVRSLKSSSKKYF